MKRKLLLLSFIVAIVGTMSITQSCNKVKELASFDLTKNMPDRHFDLDSATTTAVKGETLLFESRFTVNMDSIMVANGVDEGVIENGHFTELELLIDNPSALEEFGFLSTVSFKLSTTSDFKSSEIVAEANNIKKGDTSIILKVNSTSLDRYLQNSIFYFRLYGNVTGPVPVNLLPLILRSQIAFTVNPI
jgi:hypothetical protein